MRVSISEWSWSSDVAGNYAHARAISGAEATKAFSQMGERIQQALRLKKSPIEVSSRGIRAKHLAGIASVDNDFEVEIVPKYAHPENPHWRQDLLFMSMVSKHGELMLQDKIKATPSSANDLSALVAEVLLRLFYANRRTPLKTYRFVDYHDFTLDGEFEAENLLLPDSEGFKQRRFQFDTDNEYSATVKAAADLLCRTIRDPSVLSRLRRLMADIGPTGSLPSNRRKALPARLRRWQTLYDLSFDVARGFGLTPGDSFHQIPGFVVSTWQTWQDLIARALVLAFGSHAVKNQKKYYLGESARSGKVKPVTTAPDSVLCGESPALIVDAKYKGRSDSGFGGITEEDLYETMAFMRGTEINRAILVYPALADNSFKTGATEIIEEITLAGGETILGLSLEVNGISEPGGFMAFVEGLKKQVTSLSNPVVAAAA